ncbi:MAG: RNA polymerase sigma factor, partial [Methylococcaceae bacterium]
MTQIQFNAALLGLQDKLLYYALSLTSDQDKAQDLLQETFLKALKYRDKFMPNTNFKAWIYTIMKNTFINGYRRNVKVKKTFDSSGSDNHLKFHEDKNYSSSESV